MDKIWKERERRELEVKTVIPYSDFTAHRAGLASCVLLFDSELISLNKEIKEGLSEF